MSPRAADGTRYSRQRQPAMQRTLPPSLVALGLADGTALPLHKQMLNSTYSTTQPPNYPPNHPLPNPAPLQSALDYASSSAASSIGWPYSSSTGGTSTSPNNATADGSSWLFGSHPASKVCE